MHSNNHRWLRQLQATYPTNFTGASVLEIGAKVWGAPPDHSIRPYFTNCNYVGVDMEAGDGVDIISVASETKFQSEQFDTLAVFSVFEHDPTWRETIKHNLQWLKPGGLFMTCFGAEGNLPHLMRWALVPHQEFLDYCASLPLKMLDAFFEEERFNNKDCPGAYDAVARKL